MFAAVVKSYFKVPVQSSRLKNCPLNYFILGGYKVQKIVMQIVSISGRLVQWFIVLGKNCLNDKDLAPAVDSLTFEDFHSGNLSQKLLLMKLK